MRVFALAALAASAIPLVACSDAPTSLAPGGPRASLVESALPMADGALAFADVPLRPGVAVDLRATVFVDETRDPSSCGAEKTALAVYGFAHTAATWAPLAEAMFAESSSGICRVVALDLPGHGGSGLPEGALAFGDLLLHDYATAVLGALDALAAQGIAPRAVVAHSQGTMVVQIAQDRLVAAGSNLRKAYGVQEVALLAPTMPSGLGWAFADNGTAAGLLGGLITGDATRGLHVAIPDFLWPILFFSDLGGTTIAGAPTAADVASLGYNGYEPLASALQLVGAPPFPGRAAVARGVFAGVQGTQLTVVAFEQDQLVRPAEADALFSHLTADRNGHKFFVVTGPRSVHDMFVSDPAELLAQVRPPLP
jgi:pimeloyl-ACP methyl ester carboxylesterase